jgi:hypothetical protein
LGQEQVDTEGGVFVVQEALELGNLLPQHVWRVADTTDDTETTSVGNGGCKLGASCNVHTSKQNWVVDLEEIGGDRLDLLCSYKISQVSTQRGAV